MDAKQAQHQLQMAIQESGMSRKQWYRLVYLKSHHWIGLKAQIFFIKGKKCEECKSRFRIQVHHIRYRNIFDVKLFDLQVLCFKCHKKKHKRKRKKCRK